MSVIVDKVAQQVIVAAKETISEQSEMLTKQAETINELNKYKLAFDIASRMVELDQVDPSDFQDSFQTLLEKSAEDLAERAKILQVVDIRKDLDLGVMDDRKDKVATSTEEDGSLTPHSQESIAAARRLIEHTLNSE